MLRMLLPFSTALATCTPPQDDVMRNSNPVPATVGQGSSEVTLGSHGLATSEMAGQDLGNRGQAAQGPIPEAVSAAENSAPTPAAPPSPTSAPALPVDSPIEALGRRTLSTAFVRVGPDGHLTVELRSGRVVVLRDVVMRVRKYCGVQVMDGLPGAQYCGGYADVAAARPGVTYGERNVGEGDLVKAGRSLPKSK